VAPGELDLETLVGEIRALESEIRQTLRTSTQTANLSAVVLAIAAGAGSSRGLGAAAFSALPVLLTVVGLSNLNAAIDAAHMAEQRDWLARWANDVMAAPVFLTGELAGMRRSSRSGIAVNMLATIIMVGSWAIGLYAAWHHPWFPIQLLVTAVLITLSVVAFSDFLSIRRRTHVSLDRYVGKTWPVSTRSDDPTPPDRAEQVSSAPLHE
jgi:hypothetical protein